MRAGVGGGVRSLELGVDGSLLRGVLLRLGLGQSLGFGQRGGPFLFELFVGEVFPLALPLEVPLDRDFRSQQELVDALLVLARRVAVPERVVNLIRAVQLEGEVEVNRAGSLGRVHVNVARVVHKAGSEHERLRGSVPFRAARPVILDVILDGLLGGGRVPPAPAPAPAASSAASPGASPSASSSPPAATPAARRLLPGTPRGGGHLRQLLQRRLLRSLVLRNLVGRLGSVVLVVGVGVGGVLRLVVAVGVVGFVLLRLCGASSLPLRLTSLSFRFPGGFSLRLFSLELESSLLRSLLARRGGGSLGFVVDRLQPGGFLGDGPASRRQTGQRAPQKSPLPVGAAAAPAVGQRLVKPLVQLEHRDGVRRARELGHGEARVRVVGVHGGGGGVLGGSVVFGRDELLDNRQAVGAHLRDGSLRGFPLHLLLGPAALLRDLARRVVRLFRVVRGDHLGKHGRERGDGDASLVAPRRCFAF